MTAQLYRSLFIHSTDAIMVSLRVSSWWNHHLTLWWCSNHIQWGRVSADTSYLLQLRHVHFITVIITFKPWCHLVRLHLTRGPEAAKVASMLVFLEFHNKCEGGRNPEIKAMNGVYHTGSEMHIVHQCPSTGQPMKLQRFAGWSSLGLMHMQSPCYKSLVKTAITAQRWESWLQAN